MWHGALRMQQPSIDFTGNISHIGEALPKRKLPTVPRPSPKWQIPSAGRDIFNQVSTIV